MNYKLIRNIFITAAIVLVLLWCISFQIFYYAKELYDEHHGMHIIDKGEYGWVVPDYPSEEWATVRYEWKQKYDVAMFISDVAVYGTSIYISVCIVCGLDYIIYRLYSRNREAEK